MPLVSVMMPARNTGEYITEAIESIIAQTYTNWELIIIDDKSTDNTKEIATSFAKKDSRIKVYDGDFIGLAHTRNQIIDLSTGKYIMLQDSDDVSDPRRMKLLVQEAEKHDKSYISSDLYHVNLDLSIKKTTNFPKSNDDIRAGFKRSYNRETISPNAAIGHRSLYVQHRYKEYMKSMEDWDLVVRLSEDPEVYFQNIKEPLYYYRLNEGSETLKYEVRIPYNILLRYNEILRKKNKPEITSLEQFYMVINSNLSLKLTYIVVYILKRIQNKIKFRVKSNSGGKK